MLRADAANKGELLSERLTCAVNADSCVARGDSGLRCEGFKAEFGQIYIAEDLTVGGFHGGKNLADALAYDLLGFRIGSGLVCQVWAQRSRARSSAARCR